MEQYLSVLKSEDNNIFKLSLLEGEEYDKFSSCLKKPEMAISDWLKNSIRQIAKVSYADKYPMKKSKFTFNKNKMKIYAIRINKSSENVIHRSYYDFKVVRETLVKHFPGAIVPPLPKGRSKSVMNIFLQKILSNPFLSCDLSVKYFLDLEVKSVYYKLKQERKNRKQKVLINQGSVRWFQTICHVKNKFTTTFKDNEEFFKNLKLEFKLIIKHLKTLKSTIKNHMELHESTALLNSDLSKSVQNLLSVENSVKLICSKKKTEILKSDSKNTVKALQSQTLLHSKKYGAPMLQKRVLDPIDQEIALCSLWLKSVQKVESDAKELSELYLRLKTESRNLVKAVLEKRREKWEKQLLINYQGLLVVELKSFNSARVSIMRSILQNIANFHMIGAEKTFENWDFDKTGKVFNEEIDDFDVKETKVKKTKKRTKCKQDPLLQGEFSPEEFKIKEKIVKKQGSSVKSSLFLKIKPNEVLVGQLVSHPKFKNVYLATNAQGKQGLVHVDNIFGLMAKEKSLKNVVSTYFEEESQNNNKKRNSTDQKSDYSKSTSTEKDEVLDLCDNEGPKLIIEEPKRVIEETNKDDEISLQTSHTENELSVTNVTTPKVVKSTSSVPKMLPELKFSIERRDTLLTKSTLQTTKEPIKIEGIFGELQEKANIIKQRNTVKDVKVDCIKDMCSKKASELRGNIFHVDEEDDESVAEEVDSIFES